MIRTAQPLVTVITPVYNGATFLRECIDSVIAQTYQNWRYVVLNNASTDGSGEIAEEYARRDPRIRVEHHTTLLPFINNHNRMLEFLDPDAAYCKPLMADDWLFPECLEKLVAAAEANPSVGMVVSIAFNGEGIWGYAGIPYPTTHMSGREVCRRTLLNNIQVFGSPSEQLIRADLVRRYRPFYTQDHMHTDFESGFMVLQDADFAFVHQLLSFCRKHDGQISNRAQWLECWDVGLINVVMRYGPVYLTPEEHQARLARGWSDYYRALSRGVIKRKGKEFWEFHRRYLALKGTRINGLRLMRSTVVEFLSRAIRWIVRPLLWR